MNQTNQRLFNLIKIIQDFKQLKHALPSRVKIVEVGPRDGLQNEKVIISTQDKIDLINMLSGTGLQTIETTSFVSKKWVPQMGDAEEVYTKITKRPGVSYTALVPNIKGLEGAIASGVQEIAVFGSASETFSQKNINCSIAESLQRFRPVVIEAQKHNMRIRGYVSCVMGCPYEGEVNPQRVAEVTGQLFDMGCYEVSLGDTIGSGTPQKTQLLLNELVSYPVSQLACHFHDTFDTAIPNLLIALSVMKIRDIYNITKQNGISVIDSSIAGLGGCPYAKKASGNVCSENVVFTLHELGIETDVDLLKLKACGEHITRILSKESLCFV